MIGKNRKKGSGSQYISQFSIQKPFVNWVKAVAVKQFKILNWWSAWCCCCKCRICSLPLPFGYPRSLDHSHFPLNQELNWTNRFFTEEKWVSLDCVVDPDFMVFISENPASLYFLGTCAKSEINKVLGLLVWKRH